jgi:hypothetical protein
MRPARTSPLVLLALLAACAKEEPPPGTHPDNIAPRPVELRPEYGASVPGFDGAAKVRFDEPLANPRNLERQVTGSPAGRYEVKPGRSGLEVRPADGWREGVIYYIKLEAGVSDLLRNRTLSPVEWLFAVGGEVPLTEVDGRVIDRVSGRGARGMRLLFLGADSIPYTVVSDTGGIFEIPGLPYGGYTAVGFSDENRNFEYDSAFEPGGRTSFALTSTEDEVSVEVVVLPADTTPPVLTAAEGADSVTVRLEFDDPLDPDADLVDASLTVRDTASRRSIEVAAFAVGTLTPTAVLPDSLVTPDSVAAPVAADADTAAAEAPAGPDLTPASTRVTVSLATPLTAGAYIVEAAGFPNLRGLEGGGSAEFRYEPPPELESEPEAGEGEAGGQNGAETP